MKEMTIDEVADFAEKAGKIGKYPGSTAQSLKAAVRLLAALLSEGESRKASYVAEHIDDLIGRYVNTQASPPSSDTLGAYRSRTLRAIKDAQNFGTAVQMPARRGMRPRKQAAADAPARKVTAPKSHGRTKKKGPEKRGLRPTPLSAPTPVVPQTVAAERDTELVEYSFPLRRGLLISIHLPADFSAKEAKRVVSWIGTLSLDGDAQ